MVSLIQSNFTVYPDKRSKNSFPIFCDINNSSQFNTEKSTKTRFEIPFDV